MAGIIMFENLDIGKELNDCLIVNLKGILINLTKLLMKPHCEICDDKRYINITDTIRVACSSCNPWNMKFRNN